VIGLGKSFRGVTPLVKACGVSSGGFSFGTFCLFRLSGLPQVVHCAHNITNTLSQLSKSEVAALAQQPPDYSCFVVMVYYQGGRGPTDATDTALFGKKSGFHFRCNPIQTFFLICSEFCGFALLLFLVIYCITSLTITTSTIQHSRIRTEIRQWFRGVTANTFFFEGHHVSFASIRKSCFYCTRFRTKKLLIKFTSTIDVINRFFNRNTTASTNNRDYGSCLHESAPPVRFQRDAKTGHLLFLFLLRSIPVERPAFCTGANVVLTWYPFVAAAQTLDLFDCDFHTSMYNMKRSRKQQERRAAIPLSAKANSLLAA